MSNGYMKVLAIEASGASVSVALVGTSGVLAMISQADRHGHAAWITDMVDNLMRQTETSFDAITHIAAGVGPGSFTGIRVGLAAAQGYGIALDKPVLGLSSLAALGWSMLASMDDHNGQVLALIDTRRGNIFGQCFDHEKAISDVIDLDVSGLAASMATYHQETPFTGLYIKGYYADAMATNLTQAALPIMASDDGDVDASMIGNMAFSRLAAGMTVADYPPTPRYHSAPLLGAAKKDR